MFFLNVCSIYVCEGEVCVCVCYLRASSLQDAICPLGTHPLYDPGLQALFDEANVRQQLGELPLQTGYLL